MMFSSYAVLFATFALAVTSQEQEAFHDQTQPGFDPRAYSKNVIQCPATNRRANEKTNIDICET